MAGSLPQSGVALVAQNAGQFLSAMRGAELSLGAFGRGASSMSQIATGALHRVGAAVITMATEAIRAVGTWVAGSVTAAGDFEQSLNVLGVTSGATATELAAVAAKAKELGADLTLPTTSAQDAAEVMLELSRAGFSVQQSMDAAKGALQLSAAAQIDAATAAGIIAGAINAFGLEASDATRITDLLAGAANASQASMTDLSQGLGQAGFAFNAAQMPIEDLATSLAVLTKNNLTGSDSGTALKNAIMRLMDPTDKAAKLMASLGFSAYDANGKMKPLPTIIGDLNLALAGMTDEQRNAALGNIFLSDGMKAMIPLLAIGEDGFNALKEQVTAEGQAAALAKAQTEGWNGALAGFQSQMETLQLTIGQQLLPLLTPLAQQAAAVVGQFTAFAEAAFASGAPLGFLVAAINTALPGFSGMVAAIGSVFTALSSSLPSGTSIAQGALQGVRDVLVNVVIPAITTAATWLATNLPTAIAAAQTAFQSLSTFVQTIMPTIESIVTLAIQVMGTFWQNHGTNIQTIATGAYTAIQGFITVVLGAIQGTLAIALGLMTGDWQTQMGAIQTSNTTIWNGISTFLEGILEIIAGFFGTSLTEIATTWDSNFRKLGELATTLMGIAYTAVETKVTDIKTKVNDVIGQVVTLWNGFFGDIKTTVSEVMNDAASIVETKVSQISGAFSGIKSAIDGVISKVKSLISALSNISVPDILTPGSPTPFEIGLRGVSKAAIRAAKAMGMFPNTTFSDLDEPALPMSADEVARLVAAVKEATSKIQEMIMRVRGALSELRDTFSALDATVMRSAQVMQGRAMMIAGVFARITESVFEAIVAMKQFAAVAADLRMPEQLARGQFAPAVSNARALQLPPMMGAMGNTTNSVSYSMPIYTNQSPAVLSQSLALVEALSQ